MRSLVWTVIGRRADDRGTHVLTRLWAAMLIWRRRIRARRMLAQVDLRTMCDAGIDPVAAQYEAQRPFWIAERRLRDC